MARDDRISMPSGIGGIVRYFDEEKSKIRFKPEVIVIASIVLIILMIVLHTEGKAILGF
jgi:preprotein translocase subunit Sec61beta